MTPAALVGEGVNPWTGGPYALNATGGTTYIAREGRYWRRGRREKEFTPVTNFVVHLMNHQAEASGKVTHYACLEINGCRVDVSCSAAVFDSPKRLLTALTTAATGAVVGYPVIGDSKAKRLLPDLIRASQFGPPQYQSRQERSVPVPRPRRNRSTFPSTPPRRDDLQ